MKYHISLRTHILLLGISAICLITGIFLIIYGTISLKDANNKLRTANSIAAINSIVDNDHSIHNKNDLYQKSNSTYDENLTQSSPSTTNYLMTLVLVDANYKLDYNSMASNAFNSLKNSLTGSNTPAKLQIVSLNQVMKTKSFNGIKADVFMLVDLTYNDNTPSLQDIENALQQNSIDTLNAINMPNDYYPPQGSNQNCGCFTGQYCPRIPTTTTPAPCDPGPCTPNILIAVDTSSDRLSNHNFKKEISLLQYNLTSIFTNYNYNRIALASYNGEVSTKYTFGKITSEQEYLQDLYTMVQGQGSNLTKLFTNLATMTPVLSDPISTFVMISEINQLDVQTAIAPAQIVAQRGNLNFIILGTGLKKESLDPFNPANVAYWEFGECDEDIIINFFNNSLKCPTSCPPPTTTLPPVTPCIPGNIQCNIVFGIDTSTDVLEQKYYDKTIQVIEQNITTQINDLTNVALVSYDSIRRNYYGFGSITSRSDFNTKISSFTRNSGSNLKNLLAFYVTLLGTTDKPLSFITFISEKPTIDNDIINYANQIKSQAKLNFIILGTALKISDIQTISSSTPFEFEFGNCDIDGLVGSFYSFTTCQTPCTPTPTPCVPAIIPCNPNLIFAIDSSSDKLEYTFFKEEIEYLQNNLSRTIMHYDYSRIALVSYSGIVQTQFPFGNINNNMEFILSLQHILTKNQTSGLSLTNLMTKLNNLQKLNSDPISTYIFVSEINEVDILLAVNQAKKLKAKGELYFITLGTAVNETQLGLLQPTDITNWSLSECGEKNLTDFIHDGFICKVDCGITTTTLPPTTTPCPSVKVCYSNVRLYIDSSNDKLYEALFQQEQSLVINNLTDIIPHDMSQLAVSSINKQFKFQKSGFGTFSSKQMFVDYVKSLQEGPGYSLSEILRDLSFTYPKNKYPVSTFVFLSDKNEIDVQNSLPWVERLKADNSTLYFILLGTAINEQNILPLNPTNYTIWQFSDCGEQIVLDFFNNNFICTYECITTTVSTTTISTTPPPPTPCVEGPTQCNMIIAMDTSSDILIPRLYNATLDVIQRNISGQITDFTKIALAAYDYEVQEFFNFGQIHDQNQFNSIIGSYQQHSGSNLTKLLEFFDSFEVTNHMSYIVFISENQRFGNDVYQLAYNLMKKGRLDFVILGTDINPSELVPLSSSQPLYYNFGDCDTQNLTTLFHQYLSCNNFCTTTPPPTTTCRPPTSPCNPNLMFAFDASSQILDDYYFQNEKVLFRDNISTLIQNHTFYKNNYNRIALIPYNEIATTDFTFDKINSNYDFIIDIDSIKQGQGIGLANLLKTLDEQIPDNSDPISTYVFISNATDDDIQNAVESSRSLFQKGTLNFIIIGTAISSERLSPLYKSSQPKEWLGSDCSIQELLKFINNGIKCNDYCPPPTTTPCPESQMICDPDLIVGVDVSNNTLKQNLFNLELSFLFNNFTSIVSDFMRVDLAYYSQNAINFKKFGNIATNYEWYQDITYIKNTIGQSSGSNLYSLLSTLSQYLETTGVPSDQKPVSTYVFISNNDTTIPSAITVANDIAKKGSLNFIILGTAIKPEILNQLAPLSNIFQWDFASCTIKEVLQFFNQTRTCYCSNSTPTPTPTITTTPPPKPYLCDIIFSIDTSNDTLSEGDFNYEKSVIINNIPNIITDYSRVAVSTYDSKRTNNLNFGSKTEDYFVRFINISTQHPGTNLAGELEALNKLTFNGANKVSTFVFIATKDQTDLDNAVKSAQILGNRGNLNFIIVGTSVKTSDLAKLTSLDNIYVWDFANCPISHLMNFIVKQGSCTPPGTLTTTETPQNVKPLAYAPCKSSLTFAITTSEDKLDDKSYQKELELFTNNYIIDSDFNHFERISVVSYNEYPEVVIHFNETTDLDDFNLKFASGIQKNRNNGNSLKNLLNQLSNEFFLIYDSGLTKNYFIFVSNLSSNDITNAVPYAKKINENNGFLNFIILDNTDSSMLKKLNPRYVLTWSNDDDNNVSDFLINYIYCTKKKRRSLSIDH